VLARVVVQRVQNLDSSNVDSNTNSGISGSSVDNNRSSSSISSSSRRYSGMHSGGQDIGMSTVAPNFKDQSVHTRRMYLGSSGGIGLDRLSLGTSGGLERLTALNNSIGARGAADNVPGALTVPSGSGSNSRHDLRSTPSSTPLLLPVAGLDGDRDVGYRHNSIDELGTSYARALKPSLEPLYARPTVASETDASTSGASLNDTSGTNEPTSSTPDVAALPENSLRPLQLCSSSKMEVTSRAGVASDKASDGESQARSLSKRHHSATATDGTASGVSGIRWQRGEVLGQGAFGLVCLGLNADTGELMAVKELAYPPQNDHNDSSGTSSETFTSGDGDERRRNMAAAGGERGWASAVTVEHEVSVLQELNHPNIVRYLGTQRSSGSNSTGTVCIFMEYVPGGSVRQLLDRFGAFDEQVLLAIRGQNKSL